MQPVKLTMDMQSVTRSSNMKSTRSKMLQSSNKQNVYEEETEKYVCSDNCQENQNINMWPVKPAMNMQLPKPAIPYKYTRLCSDKDCQFTRCYKKKDQVKSVCSGNNCLEIQNINMQPKKPISHMRSVTKTSFMYLSKPAIEQSTHKLNQDSKSCQSDRCVKKKCPVRPVCNDRRCQSVNF